MAQAGCWNHNVHYERIILGAVPVNCGSALEVGCGDGMLACRLAERCAAVTAIDRDARMISLARTQAKAWAQAKAQTRAQAPRRDLAAGREPAWHGVTFAEADFLAYPMTEASFDFVCANTSLHHMDYETALTAMARVLRPGGRLAVIGLAANGSAGDYLAGAPGVPVNWLYRAVYRGGSSGAPVKDPEMTWAEVRAVARGMLPGRALPPSPAMALFAALAQTSLKGNPDPLTDPLDRRYACGSRGYRGQK